MTGIWLFLFLTWFTLYLVIGFISKAGEIVKINEKVNIVCKFIEDKLDWIVKLPKYIGIFMMYVLIKINDLINFFSK